MALLVFQQFTTFNLEITWILSLATFESERVNIIPRGTDQILVPVTQIKNRFSSPFRTLFLCTVINLKWAPAYEFYTVHKLGDWFVDGIDLGFAYEQVL